VNSSDAECRTAEFRPHDSRGHCRRGSARRLNAFYKDILASICQWQAPDETSVDWSGDARSRTATIGLEYMLNIRNPTPRRFGVMHHFGLMVRTWREPQTSARPRRSH